MRSPSSPIIEICVDSLESLVAAQQGGAHRVELCSALSEGGLTPSIGFARKAKELCPELIIHAMLRPRSGGFVYNPIEQEMMLEELVIFRELNIDGIVVGALTPEGKIDRPFLEQIVEQCKGKMSITFHRAFDLVDDQEDALLTLCDLGIQRILTSGGQASATQGAEQIRRLIALAEGRLVVMPGAGIGPENIQALMLATRATEYHLSAKVAIREGEPCKPSHIQLGHGKHDEFTRYVASEKIIAEVLRLSSLSPTPSDHYEL